MYRHTVKTPTGYLLPMLSVHYKLSPMVLGILGESALVLSIISFALALNAATKTLLNKLNSSFLVLCLLISSWAFTFALDRYLQTGVFYKLHLILNLFLAPVGMYFLKILTRHQSKVTKALYRLSLVYAFGVIALIIFKDGYSERVNVLANFGPTLLGLECFYLLSVRNVFAEELSGYSVMAMKTLTGSTSGRAWIYFGAIFLLFTAVMDHVPFVGEIVPAIGNLFVCIYLFIISEIVIHQRTLNIATILSKLTTYIVIGILSTFVFLTFTVWIDRSFTLFALNSFFASIIVLIIFEPSREIFYWINARVLNRRYFFFEQKIKFYIESLNEASSIKELNQKILDLSQKVLNASRVRIFIFKPDQARFIRTMGVNDDDLKAIEINESHPILNYFYEIENITGSPVLLDKYVQQQFDTARDENTLIKTQNILKLYQELNCNVFFPLIVGTGKNKNILGLVTAFMQNPPNPWGDNWGFLSIVFPFFEKVGSVLKNQDTFIQLREKDRFATIGEMSAGLAHEIRNPLGAIKGAAQYLKTSQGDKLYEFLNVIEEEVNRLNHVVTRFLEYSKPYELNEESIELGKLLNQTLTQFQKTLERSEINKIIQFELKLNNSMFSINIEKVNVKVDVFLLKQVMINLMQNSVEALTNSKKNKNEKFLIVLGTEILENKDLTIYVEDNGPGIDSATIEKIFIPFYTSSPQGTGLGLSISSKIIEAHSGKIDVISKANLKTKFTIHLPSSRVQL